jgi:hypothetical protein
VSTSRVALAALCAAALVASVAPGLRPADPSTEVARIRRHLAGAEALLLSRDVSALTAVRREARARRIADLRVYRRRGIFPHNHQGAGRRTPVFVDEHGTRCAMADLIERSGGGAMVARIAATRNLARIRDLAGDAELTAWLDRNGMTLAEAARIQPEYGDEVFMDRGPGVAAWAMTAAGAGIAATGVGLNVSLASSPNARRSHGVLGVACGLLGCALGATGLSKDGSIRALGAVDVGLGLASFGLGLRQLDAPRARTQTATRSMAPAMWRDATGVRRLALVMRF